MIMQGRKKGVKIVGQGESVSVSKEHQVPLQQSQTRSASSNPCITGFLPFRSKGGKLRERHGGKKSDIVVNTLPFARRPPESSGTGLVLFRSPPV